MCVGRRKGREGGKEGEVDVRWEEGREGGREGGGHTSSAIMKKKLTTCSGWPENFFRRRGSLGREGGGEDGREGNVSGVKCQRPKSTKKEGMREGRREGRRITYIPALPRRRGRC